MAQFFLGAAIKSWARQGKSIFYRQCAHTKWHGWESAGGFTDFGEPLEQVPVAVHHSTPHPCSLLNAGVCQKPTWMDESGNQRAVLQEQTQSIWLQVHVYDTNSIHPFPSRTDMEWQYVLWDVASSLGLSFHALQMAQVETLALIKAPNKQHLHTRGTTSHQSCLLTLKLCLVQACEGVS